MAPFAEAINTFGAKLLVEYRQEVNANENILLSPLNLASAFLLMYHGSAGNTRQQISALFNFNDERVIQAIDDKETNLENNKDFRMTYRVYMDKAVELKHSYKQHVGPLHVAEENFLENAASLVTDINNWVSSQTDNMIQNLLNSTDIDKDTIMLIVNALYFKGTWKNPFCISNTENDEFYGINGSQNIPFMNLDDGYINYKQHTELGGQLFRLPYKGGQFSMYVFLPNDKDGWREAEMKLPKYINNLFDGGFVSKKLERLQFPKWNLDFKSSSLRMLLENLGIQDAFNDKADFSNMVERSRTCVDGVIHQTKIIVDENGTVAAAATGSVMRFQCYIPTLVLRVNHPFLYFIVDDLDKTVLFQGSQLCFPSSN